MESANIIGIAIEQLKKTKGEALIVIFLACGVYVSTILPGEQRIIGFSITVVVFLVLFLYFYVYIKPESQISMGADDVVFFDAPKTGGYNEEFYEYFYSRIRNATTNIYVTGEGLICRDEHEKNLARRLADAYRSALGRGVSITRVQYKTTEDQSYWLGLVKDLLIEYPQYFHLYVIEANTPQITHICSIDPEVKDDNYTELMMPSQKLFGPESKPIAGAAVFIKGRQHLAKLMHSKVRALIDGKKKIAVSQLINQD